MSEVQLPEGAAAQAKSKDPASISDHESSVCGSEGTDNQELFSDVDSDLDKVLDAPNTLWFSLVMSPLFAFFCAISVCFLVRVSI